MKNLWFAFLLAACFSNVMANDLTCTATKILFPCGVKVGDVITFNEDRSLLNNDLQCEKAPAFVAQQLNASMVLGCGAKNDKDIFIFNQDQSEVELDQLVLFSCN
jgi:hypothetical protein